MSKLLKSKFLVGVLMIAMFAFAGVALAADGAITMTLKQGMKNVQVKYLQQTLNEKGYTVATTGAGSAGNETTTFGPATAKAVKAFQAANGLAADGVVGRLSRAALGGAVSGGLPAGCTSTSGYSPTTGVPCNSGGTVTYPAGCTSASGYSATTGLPCSGTVVSGPVSVALATDNPASSTLVAGQATADLAHFAFTGSGTVTGVTLQRIGVSADATPSNVYLFDGATRLTDAASVASNGTVTFSAPSGLFTVNGSKTIAVKSDIAADTSGQTVGMKLVSFTTSAGVSTVNISGNIHTIATATLAAVSAGTVTPTGATINPGTAVTLWQSTLTISTRDVLMKRVAFRNVGSAPAASFANFKLYVNGVQVGTAVGVDANGYVTFDFMSSPVKLQSGARIVRLDADVVSGASRTVQFSLRNAADVDFVDSSFGVNITPTSTPWSPASASTISGSSGGTLTIEKDVSSPSSNIVNGGNDVVLGIFKVTAYGEPIKIETLRAAYTGSANIADDADSLRNARLLINGVQYGSTASLNETTDTVLAYTSYTLNYTVVPGTPVLVELRADVYDNGGANDIVAGTDTIQAVIAAGSSNAQRVDSLGSFSAPSTAVSANTLTIATTGITLSQNTTYANQSTTLPTTNYKIGSWNLAGSSIEDVLLSTLSFDVDEVVGTEFDEGDITNLSVVVKNGSTIVAQPSPIATLSVGGQDNNFSINYTLAKNSSVTIELFGNLADDGQDDTTSTSSGASNAIDSLDSFKTDLTVTGTSLVGGSAVTATSADTDGQTIAYGTAYITAAVDASSPELALVSDNQVVTSAAFKFSAVTAGFNVTDVQLTIPATGVTSVQSVMLYDGSTLLATLPGAATVSFSGLTWNVPANTSKVLTVKLQLGTVGLGAGTSGGDLTTTLDVYTSVNTSTGASDASAADTEQSREATSLAASAQYAYAAIPTFSQGSVSAAITNAIENDLYKFVVTPNGGDIALKQLKFTQVFTDNTTDQTLTIGSLKLYRGSTDISADVDIHNTAGATLENTNSLGEGATNTFIITWNSEEQISQATEYTIKGTPTGFTVGSEDDSININIASDSAAHTATYTYLVDLDSTSSQTTVGLSDGVAGTDTNDGTMGATVTDGPNVVWSDISAIPHSETVPDEANTTQDAATSSADWTNGYLVQSLPLAGMTKTN